MPITWTLRLLGEVRPGWSTSSVYRTPIPNSTDAGGRSPKAFPSAPQPSTSPRGYRSLFGWVQVVRSTDNESGGLRFELDPFALFGDAPSPYCWYGQRPILFDAPSRPIREPLEWVAHSFLATTPLDEVAESARRVVPLVGFSWGFTDTSSTVILANIEVLTDHEWTEHLDVLRRGYPAWVFSEETER